MSEGAAPPPDQPALPHGATVTLDLYDGFNGYTQAMEAVLNRIVAGGYPGDPRRNANLMIFEIFNYLEGLLPGIDVREMCAFYGSIIGFALGGHIHEGTLEEQHGGDYMASIFYSSMRHTIPTAIKIAAAAEGAEETGLVGPDGRPVSALGPVVGRIPRPKKLHGLGKSKKRRRKK